MPASLFFEIISRKRRDIMSLSRLDKLIALNCNVSRKEAREIIKDGKVTVNGRLMLRAEELIDSALDEVSVKGFDFTLKNHIYIMLNKPEGVITATKDEHKKTVLDLIPPGLSRKSLFPCGRLDKDTTGLLILTDDGDMCHRIVSPNHSIFKTYTAILSRPLDSAAIKKLESGIVLKDGTECMPAKVRYFTDDYKYCAEIKISEGKYHQVKRMFAAAGNHVDKLKRTQIGSLKLDNSLAEGECREISKEELQLIFE